MKDRTRKDIQGPVATQRDPDEAREHRAEDPIGRFGPFGGWAGTAQGLGHWFAVRLQLAQDRIQKLPIEGP